MIDVTHAACSGMDTEQFFPANFSAARFSQAAKRKAHQICAGCQIRPECLTEHLFEPHGIFGGHGVTRRREIAKQRGLAWPQPEEGDPIAVERAISGTGVLPLRRVDRLEAVRRMSREGTTVEEMASRLGVNVRVIVRDRATLASARTTVVP